MEQLHESKFQFSALLGIHKWPWKLLKCIVKEPQSEQWEFFVSCQGIYHENALDSKSSGHGLSPVCDGAKEAVFNICAVTQVPISPLQELQALRSLHTLKIPCHLLIREGLTARGKETHR